MKVFEDSRGFIIAFGWDMFNRKKEPNMVSWCDPKTKDWQISPINMAGNNTLGFPVTPEFIMETRGGVVAYQPGVCIEMTFIAGSSFVWHFQTMLADRPTAIAA